MLKINVRICMAVYLSYCSVRLLIEIATRLWHSTNGKKLPAKDS